MSVGVLHPEIRELKVSEIISTDPLLDFARKYDFDTANGDYELAVLAYDLDDDNVKELFITSISASEECNGNNSYWIWYVYKNIGDGKWVLMGRQEGQKVVESAVAFAIIGASVISIMDQKFIVDIGHAGSGSNSLTFICMQDGVIKSIFMPPMNWNAEDMDGDENSRFFKSIFTEEIKFGLDLKFYEFDKREILSGAKKVDYEKIISEDNEIEPRKIPIFKNVRWEEFWQMMDEAGINIGKMPQVEYEDACENMIHRKVSNDSISDVNLFNSLRGMNEKEREDALAKWRLEKGFTKPEPNAELMRQRDFSVKADFSVIEVQIPEISEEEQDLRQEYLALRKSLKGLSWNERKEVMSEWMASEKGLRLQELDDARTQEALNRRIQNQIP